MYLHRPHPPPLTPTFPAAFSVCPPTRLIQSGLPQDASIGGIWTYETQPNSDAVDHAGSDIVVETDSSGNVTREALFGPGVDRLEYLKVGSTTVAHRFPLEDARGSVLNVVDEQGTTTTTFSYSAFGETTRTSGEAFPYAFSGRRYLESLKLYDFRNRFYDPWLGRFLQRDPIGIWGDGVGLGNGYAYVGNNPVSRIDPFGLGGVDTSIEVSPFGRPDLAVPIDWTPDQVEEYHRGRTWVPPKEDDEEDCETSPKTFAEAKLQCHLTPTQYLDYIERKRFLESIGIRQATISDFLAVGARPLQFVGGAAQAAAGVALVTGTGGLGALVGVALTARGADHMAAAIMGTTPVVEQGVTAAARGLGAGETASEWIGRAAGLGLDVGLGAWGNSLSATGVASGVGQSAPMQVVRVIKHGEKLDDIINEAKALTFTTGNEHALVKLATGERALVSGGPGGIRFTGGQVTRIFGHTHPTSAPTSRLDFDALRRLGQTQQTVLHGGQTTKIRP